MKILISGIPGTGKTTIGEYLANHHGFLHLDMESSTISTVAVRDFLNKPGDKVITWGFVPKSDDETVKYFLSLGYRMVWFDGNHAAARKAFNKRGTVSESLLDLQLSRIKEMNLKSFNPITINTFKENGEFRKEGEIVTEIKQLLS